MGDILILTNEDPRFYALLGPYLARREIVAELGFPVYDDPGKVWFVALDGEAVAGFTGLRLERGKAHFTSDYVRPGYRQQGVYDRLMAARLTYASDKASNAHAAVTKAAQHTYERHGFLAGKQYKRYTKVSRSLP